MKKEKYERAEPDVIEFQTEDVFMTSMELEEDELPFIRNQH